MLVRIRIPTHGCPRRTYACRAFLGSWVIEDAGSKNGTWLNGQRVTRATLPDGALLELGQNFLLYRDAPPASDPKK